MSFIFFSARLLVPNLLRQFARLKSRESMILLVLLLCLGTAFLTEKFGVSLAMGAFIAGLIISESEYSHQIVVEIFPLRDFFSSIFFVSLGMLFNIHELFDNLSNILLLTGMVIFLKAFFAFIAMFLVLRIGRIAFTASLRLAQIGKFSFIMAGTGLTTGLISKQEFNLFVVCAILSMFLSPLLIHLSSYLPYWFFPELISRGGKWEKEGELLNDHVIICGYGQNGQHLTRVLKETQIKYLVIDFNGEHLEKARQFGVNFMYGDVSRREILIKAGAKNAKVVVFAISDAMFTRRGVRIVRKANPDAHILIRTKQLS